jgi:hypothetical protein
MNISLKSKGLYRDLMCVIVVLIALSAAPVMAVDVAFHGYFEANSVWRDLDGFQEGGYFNDTRQIQQRNTLKFDVDAYIKKPLGPVVIDKVHLTYRGFYDTIFDTSSEYDDMFDTRGGRFDYGQDDIRMESDLREAFVDITYNGSGAGFFRPGRQIVSWGEVSGATIVDRINPSNGSFTMSAFPDELKTPLWMARLNYSLPPQPGFNLNFDMLVIPDVRPTQLAPVDKSGQAPYISNTPIGMISQFSGVSEALGVPDIWEGVEEDVDTDETEYAGRVTGDIGANLSLSLYYLHTANDSPGPRMSKTIGIDIGGPLAAMPQKVYMEHDMTDTYGTSFNTYVAPIDIVLKGEFGYTTGVNYMRDTSSAVEVEAKHSGTHNIPAFGGPVPYGPDYELFDTLDTWTGMIGIDKAIWARWFSSSQINTGFQYIHEQIVDIGDEDDFIQGVAETRDLFSFLAAWDWMHGKIAPSVFVMYDTADTWMTNVSVKYTMTPHLYFKLDQLAFLGDDEAKGLFGTLIGGDTYHANSQVQFIVGYQW